MGLKMSVFFRRPVRPITDLPASLADVIADDIAEYAGQDLRLRQVAGLATDHRHQSGFVFGLAGGIGRDHDGLFVRGQGIDGAVTDVQLCRQQEGLL